MIREILIWPDSRLKARSKTVAKVDDSVRQLIDDLFATMYDAEGVGLAAPQVGELARVLVIDTSPRQEGQKPMAFVNPEIASKTGSRVYREGCLSIPGEAEEVERADQVVVRALDRDGKPFEVKAEGLLATALQHEIDHLDGMLFVDYLSSLKRELIKKRMKRLKAERAEEAKDPEAVAKRKKTHPAEVGL